MRCVSAHVGPVSAASRMPARTSNARNRVVHDEIHTHNPQILVDQDGDSWPASPAASPVVVRISSCSQCCSNKSGDCPATLHGNSFAATQQILSRLEFSLRFGWMHHLVLYQQSQHLRGHICSTHWTHNALQKPISWQECATSGYRTCRYVDAQSYTE